MSLPIGDHALIGDTHTTALVSSQGSIDWWCWARHDAPALLTKLLDDAEGGYAGITLDESRAVSRAYLPRTNILLTRFAGGRGDATLTDFMALFERPGPPGNEPDADPQDCLVRMVACTAGTVGGRFVFRFTPDFGRGVAEHVDVGTHACRIRIGGGETLHLASSHPIVVGDGRIVVAFSLAEGERAFVGVGSKPPPPIDESLERTRAFWDTWTGGIRYDGSYRDAVVRSVLVLKLLTYAPTGAIIAAPTTSLPEAVPGDRNFDYRYSWVRDASFSVTAFCGVGLQREASDYLHFLCRSDGTRGRALRPLYGIDGDVPDETRIGRLPGWNGVGPVRVGNAAVQQAQHDIDGEFLLALHGYLDAVDDRPPGAIADGLAELVTHLADHAAANRDGCDHGIWEFRTARAPLLHSKALLWVALDRAVRIADRVPGIAAADVARWSDVARDLRAEYERDAWSDSRGAYVQGYRSDVLDASVLRAVLFGALDAGTPRMRSTLQAIERELVVDEDLVYRYRRDDGFAGDEGTFTACAFWRVGVLALAGETRAARDAFERLLRRGNDVGLFAEEIDAPSGEQRGNFPQGFTHMAIVNCALRLDLCLERFGLRGAWPS